jgi:hypothetical protein
MLNSAPAKTQWMLLQSAALALDILLTSDLPRPATYISSDYAICVIDLVHRPHTIDYHNVLAQVHGLTAAKATTHKRDRKYC